MLCTPDCTCAYTTHPPGSRSFRIHAHPLTSHTSRSTRSGRAPLDCRGPPASEGLKDAALDVASAAKAHLDEARRLAGKLPPAAPPLLLQGVLVGAYLDALQAKGFDLFHPDLPAGGVSPLRRAVMVKWASVRGRY